MFQAPLPQEYARLASEEARRRITEAKKTLGARVVILGHHYQRDEIIEHADYRGDSFKLAKDANRHPETEYIVFCGVHSMAVYPPTRLSGWGLCLACSKRRTTNPKVGLVDGKVC